MTSPVLVVVAARPDEVEPVEMALRHQGASSALPRREVGAQRILVYGGFPDDVAAARAVDNLRRDGWPAVARPPAGPHLAVWQTHTAPLIVGSRVQICFPWSEARRDDGPPAIEIDPGRGFGTGAHPTTRLLLAELVERLRPEQSVLDVGCGSGVLAVVAARLGASRVAALDIAPEALLASRRNAERNGVADLVEVTDRSPEGIDGTFDVVLANIAREVLVDLAPAVSRRLRPDGWLGLSGLSPAQVDPVQAAYRPLKVERITRDDDWMALILRHGEAGGDGSRRQAD